jgi:SAM-dependent methyltransferase
VSSDILARMSTRPEDQPDVARWDDAYSKPPMPVLEAIMRRHLTSAYPPEVHATTVWPTWDLDIIAGHLRLAPGATLLDLPCGLGELGLWVSAKIGCALIGVDPSSVGLDRARQRAREHQRDDATFVEGHFLELPLPDASVNAIMSIDGIHFVTDIQGTFREMRRVLHDGARCVLVGAEPLQATDRPRWSTAIADEGFTVLHEEPTPDWSARFHAAWREVGENEEEIRAEADDGGETAMGHVERAAALSADVLRHVLVVAEAR